MANIKFSQFTADGNIDGGSVTAKTGSETSFLVGYDSTGNTNNMWTFPQIAEGLIAVTAKPYSIYAADGTIGASRVATITDFPKFSGTQSNPIGLEIENTETSASAHSTQGAQLKLTARAGASSTISFYNGQGGGSSGPAMVVESPAGIRYTAGAAYADYHHSFSRSGGWIVGMTNSPLNIASPKLEMRLAGGGSNGSFYTTKIAGQDDYLYMFMSPGTAARHIALGEYTNSTTTYKDFLRINSTGDIGINQDTPAEKLHVTGNVKIDGQAYTELHTGVTPLDPNWNNGNVQESTLTSGGSDFDPINPKAGATYILKLTQPGTADGVVNWSAASATVYWSGGSAPTLTASAGAVDIITLICTSTTNAGGGGGGGTYYANATLNFS